MNRKSVLPKIKKHLPAILFTFLFTLTAPHTHAADGTNPATGNPSDYGGAGDWVGTIDSDRFTNDTGATVNGNIDMRQGGNDTVINDGTVIDDILGSSDGSNRFINTSNVNGVILGSDNNGSGNNGSNNYIKNSGRSIQLIGSDNFGPNSSGGFHTIINDGLTIDILGSINAGNSSNGGHNSIFNLDTILADLIGTLNEAPAAPGTPLNLSGGFNFINNTGTIGGNIAGTYNEDESSSGGNNRVDNSGTVNVIFGSFNDGDHTSGGNNSITNTGRVLVDLVGDANEGMQSNGGGNTINNSGIVENEILGSSNDGIRSYGGNNTIINSGTVLNDVYGSYNFGDFSSGGNNTITNSGTVVDDLRGSANYGDNSSGGDNIIRNSGSVKDNITGDHNTGLNSHGGGNTITNTGTVAANLYGSLNGGVNSHSRGNIIYNHGTVHGSIYGSLNTGVNSYGGDDLIRNSGRVGGDIIGADGNDTIIIVGGSFLGGVADGGTGNDILGFDNIGTIDGSVLGTIYLNFENLTVYGGSNNLVGNWDFSHGNTDILKGSLLINGNLNSRLFVVHADGLLGGSGTITSNVTNHGTISPGNSIGTLNIKGSVQFMPGSTYMVELQPDGRGDKLSVTGNVSIDGSTLKTSLSRALYRDGDSWSVITASDGITGSFNHITQPRSETLQLHTVPGLNQIVIEVSRKSFSEFGATDNHANVGRAFDSIVPLATGEMASFITSMDFNMDKLQIQNVLGGLNPEMHTAFSAIGLQSVQGMDKMVSIRQSGLRSRHFLSPLPETSAHDITPENNRRSPENTGWDLWTRVIGNWAERKTDPDYLAYDVNGGGIIAGADLSLNEALLLGVYFGYSSGDLEWNDKDHQGSTAGSHIGIYASIDMTDFYWDASASFGRVDNDAVRHISFNEFSTGARSDFSSHVWQGRVESGYNYTIDNWLFNPVISAGYGRIDQERFVESGAGIFNLTVQDSTVDSISSSVSVRVSGLFENKSWQIRPRAEVGWMHQFEENGIVLAESFSAYNAVSLDVAGMPAATDLGILTAGCVLEYGKKLSLHIDYTSALGNGESWQFLSAGLSWKF